MRGLLERSRFVVALASVTALVCATGAYIWGVAKAGAFAIALAPGGSSEDLALVKLFESLDILFVGTVLMIVALGLWELFISDLDLPPSLSVTSFQELKSKVANTLVLVLVVRFLETLVASPTPEELLATGLSVTLVGGLLILFSR